VQEVIKQSTATSSQVEGGHLANHNCLSMTQAIKLASLLEVESTRLSFRKSFFMHIYDLDNYHSAELVFSHAPYKHD
jgi:hypothetical protein